MSAFLRAAVAGIFMLEISAAFMIGFVTLILFALHAHGVLFWGVETITAGAAMYLSGLFFLSALKYERQAQMVDVRSGDTVLAD